MNALAQGCAGLALVMGFALLRSRQVAAAAAFLSVQSAAVALAVMVLHQPLMAIPPVLLGGGTWLLRHRTPMLEAGTAPAGGAKLGIATGAVLAIVCQSQGNLALPLAIILLSVLLAATRSHPVMQIIALTAAQNGISLAGSFAMPPVLYAMMAPSAAIAPLACLVLPLPLAVGLLAPALMAAHGIAEPRPALSAPLALIKAMTAAQRLVTARFGWIDVTIASAVFAATLLVPLDGLASAFAPLLGLDGALRSWARRNRSALTPGRRGLALLQSSFTVLTVCTSQPVVAWLALLAAASAAMIPMLTRRWDRAVLAFFATGLALFGMLLVPATPSVPVYFSLFAGFIMIAAMVPDLGPAIAVLVLRLADQAPWPPAVEALGSGMALLALLACAGMLIHPARAHRTTLLPLAQASIAALAICLGQPEDRFAALIMMVLLLLTRSATRCVGGPAAQLALAGLGGIPPLGVFPGLVLVVLALSAHAPWLLLPLGLALIPIASGAFPARFPTFAPRLSVPSIAWLPLLLSVLAGYCAPEQLVHWWRILTAGRA